MKKFAAAVLVSAMAMLGSVPAASALEPTTDDDFLCVAHGYILHSPGQIAKSVTFIDSYIVLEYDYSNELMGLTGKVCSGFSTRQESYDKSREFIYQFEGSCRLTKNTAMCDELESISSTDIGGDSITSDGVVHLGARHDVEVDKYAG